MLEDYARRNGLPNPKHFTDDGISDPRFDRSGFLVMMEGKTTYKVRVHFSETSTETMSDKIKHMLKNEIQQM